MPLAVGALGREEAVARSPPTSACMTGCSGIVRLQQHAARPFGAPRAPRDLMEQLEGALGRAQVAARSGRDRHPHPTSVRIREMMALGDDLRADQDVDLAPRSSGARIPRPPPGR
jgi:hypothetical protein